MRIDNFSGAAADLPKAKRSYDNVLRALAKMPRVSVWDMEQAWLRNCLQRLQLDALIVEDKAEPYPWLHFSITAAGQAYLATPQSIDETPTGGKQ